jgi:acetyl esterase/lipase
MKRIHHLTILTAIVLVTAASAAMAGSGDAYSITNDVVYGHKMGMALTYDVIQPKEGANGAGIMFMNSGGWFSRWFDPAQTVAGSGGRGLDFKNIVDSGYTLYIVRHGSAPLFKVPDAVKDVKLATRHIKLHAGEYGVDPNRLGVFGGSAGGHLSLMIGTDSDEGSNGSKDPVRQQDDRVAAVVAYFPPVDLRDFVGPNERFPALDFDAELADNISPILHVTKDDPPTLMIHGDKDDLVPLDHSKQILAAFQKEGVDTNLIVIEGAGHGFRGDDAKEASVALIAWFDKYLAK